MKKSSKGLDDIMGKVKRKSKWLEDPEAQIRIRFNKLKYEYGLTPDDYNGMYDGQKGLCKSCDIPIERFNKHTHIDHCHDYPQTEQLNYQFQRDPRSILGLLCRDCNISRGAMGNDAVRIKKLMEYQQWVDSK